ncbi:hypothetical protein ma342 [Moumouvirus australiensis]|uniref:Uncharacterized protein n=1 Tax=Moumouvirus australiensis TaxID=2109587 RepID=A0A2P1ELI6_9VIRU|nr:hypothetical protein QKC55_gp563 [Moumouvirus australiensis]AVL94728.1 hypothetical protein ma342 [Moumouvirus australiensis]
MKLIIILFLVVIIFFIIYQIQKPKENVNENIYEKFDETNKKICDNYVSTKIKESNIVSNFNQKFNYNVKKYINPNTSSKRIKISDLVKSINNNYSCDIIFNPANNPIIQTSDNFNDILKGVSKRLKKDINFWNYKLLKFHFKTKINILDMIPYKINQTSNEFIMEIIIYTKIQCQDSFFKIIYYGSINKDLNFFSNDLSNKYIIQFVELSLLTKEMYQNMSQNIKLNENPFMTMNEQMEYVNKINKLHQEEIE